MAKGRIWMMPFAAAVIGAAALQGCGGRAVINNSAAGKGSEAFPKTASGQPSSGAVSESAESSSAVAAVEKKPHAIFITSKGRIVARLFPDAAPKTVANFIDLATGKKTWTDPTTGQETHRPLYNGTLIHRVIPDFMIQGGDPLGNGVGGPGYAFEDEFSPAHPLEKPGLLAMANSGPNTNGSQFFITAAATPWLTNHHTVFGEVVEGYDVVAAITKVPRDPNDRPLDPVTIQEVRIEYR